MANDDDVAPWIVVFVITFTIGRAFIGSPDWLQRLGRDRRGGNAAS